jgi:hypothetical protein
LGKLISFFVDEFGNKPDRSCLLAIPEDFERVILSTIEAKLCNLDAGEADSVGTEGVLIPDANDYVVSETQQRVILSWRDDLEIEFIVPLWSLASILCDFGLELIL